MRLVGVDVYWISTVFDVMEFMPKLWETYNQAMNFLMLFIPCIFTRGFIFDRNFNRNETMVDLSKTPESIRINIINQYKEQTPQHGRLMEYFVEKRLKNLMEHIEEFE